MHELSPDKCNGNAKKAAFADADCAEQLSAQHNMSDICPPDFSLWTAEDDLLLKNAVESGTALEALAKGAVRFSHRFTVKELRERWHALLYNPEISEKAAAGMVEIERTQMSLSKTTRSSKLKLKDNNSRKRRLENVRNHYYQMKKRINAERILPIDDKFTFPNDIVSGYTGSGNEVMQEGVSTMHEGLPVTVCMEGVGSAPPFGFSESGHEIEDKTIDQMVSFLANGGDDCDFPRTNMDSLEVSSVAISLMPNDCYHFPQQDSSVMLSATAVGGDNGYFSPETIQHSVKEMSPGVVQNAFTMHKGLYVVESSLPSDTTGAALTVKNETAMNTVHVVNHSPVGFKSIDAQYIKTEGLAEHLPEEITSASGVLSRPCIRNWEADPLFLISPMTSSMKDKVNEPIESTEDKQGTNGPKEPLRYGHSVDSSLTTKAEVHILSKESTQSIPMEGQNGSLQQTSVLLPDSIQGANVCTPSNGQAMFNKSSYFISGAPEKDESEARPSQCVENKGLSCSDSSALERTICTESKGLQMTSVPECQAPVLALAGQEENHDSFNLGDIPAYSASQTLLFVHGPMDCALNTEDTDVPCNDEFNPLAYQHLFPSSAVGQSSCVEQTTVWGSFSTEGNIGHSHTMSLCPGQPVVKEEPKTLEPLVDKANELKPQTFKDGESNKFCTDHRCVKMEVSEFTAPSVVCQEVVVNKDDWDPDIPSCTNIFPVALKEGFATMPSALEKTPTNRFDLLLSQKSVEAYLQGNDGSLDFSRPLQFDVALPIVDQNLQDSQAISVAAIEVGDFQATSFQELTEDQFVGNQEVQLLDSDDELPHFSDVEAMILDMDLDPGEDENFSARAESRRMYKKYRKAIVRLEQSANSALQRSLGSKGAYAILYGHHLRYFIKKNEVTLGRVTQENIVDIDLAKEGPANKVSRRQATIKLKEDGLFYLENHGRRAIAVNSRDIFNGQRIRLGSNYLIEVGGMRFIFEINRRLVKQQVQHLLQG